MSVKVHFSGEGLESLFDEEVTVKVEYPENTTIAELKEKLKDEYPTLARHDLLCFHCDKDTKLELVDQRTVLSYLDLDRVHQRSLNIAVEHRVMALPVTMLFIDDADLNSSDILTKHIVMVKSNSTAEQLADEIAHPDRNPWCSLIRIYGPGGVELTQSDLLRDVGVFDQGSSGVVAVEKRASNGGDAQGNVLAMEHARELNQCRSWANTNREVNVSDYKKMFKRFPTAIQGEVSQPKPCETPGQQAGKVLNDCLSSISSLPLDVCPQPIEDAKAALSSVIIHLDATERADVSSEFVEILKPLKEELTKLATWKLFNYPRERLHEEYMDAMLALDALIDAKKNNTPLSREDSDKLLPAANDLQRTLGKLTRHWGKVTTGFEPTQATITKVADQKQVSANRLQLMHNKLTTEVQGFEVKLIDLISAEKACASFHTEGLAVLKECKSVVVCQRHSVESEVESIDKQIAKLNSLKQQKQKEVASLMEKESEIHRAHGSCVKMRNSFVEDRAEATRKCAVRKEHAECAVSATGILLGAYPLLATKMHEEHLFRVSYAREMKTKLAGDITAVFSAQHRNLYLKYLAKDGTLSHTITKKNELEAEELRLRALAGYDDDAQKDHEDAMRNLEIRNKKITECEEEIDDIKKQHEELEHAHNPVWSFLHDQGWIQGVGKKARVCDSKGNETLTGFGAPGLKLTLPYEEEAEINKAAADAFNGQVARVQNTEAEQLQQRGIAAAASGFFSSMLRLTGGGDAN
mmetsp:Transcript_36322/g.85201  ORF Transcript_36322/g.85201 Transcript_36322/m.85201 type:complete len:752 (+) Transcript_36322:136-2391(+)